VSPRVLLLSSLLLLVTGCVIVPIPQKHDVRIAGLEETIARLEPGKTTREEVRTSFAEYATVMSRTDYDDNRWWVYVWSVRRGTAYLINLNPYGSGAVVPPAAMLEFQAMAIEFDPDGRLRRLKRFEEPSSRERPRRAALQRFVEKWIDVQQTERH
jgi:outer membrane protein assembly factor BamE (lipoprotein component of BamABCDE complex)